MRYVSYFTYIVVLFMGLFASAAPKSTTFKMKIVKPDGSSLDASSVAYQFTTLAPTGSCILYVEQFSNVSMAGTDGSVIFNLGSGTTVFSGTGTNFTDVFNNNTASINCQTSGSFIPGASDRRRIVVQFNDGSAAGWQTLPAVDINSVPYANFADDSIKLSGKLATDFVLSAAVPDCSTTGKVLTYNGSAFSCASSSAGSGTVTNVTSTNSYISVATGTTTPAITANVGTAVNTLAAGNDSRITGAAQKASNLSDLASASTARTNLGSTTTGDALFTSASATTARTTLGSTTVGDALFTSASATAARTTLGLGTSAVLDAGTSATNLVQLDGAAKIPTALLPSSATFWQDAGSGKINYNGGFVGIGTANPFGAIHVDGADSNSQIFATNTDSTVIHNPGFVSYNFDGAGLGGYPKVSLRSGRGSIGAQLATQAGDILGALEFQGNRSGNWTTPVTIQGIATETQAAGARGGAISFMTTKAGTSTLSEKVRIDSNGNMGFGFSSPTANIHLKAGTAAAGTAPIKLTAGTNLTTAEAGAIEFDGTNLYYTDSVPTRRTLVTTSGGGSFTNVTSIANSGGNITLAPNSTTGTVQVTSSTASTGASNGALVVNGGVGVGGDIYATSSINAGTTITALTSILTPQLYGSAAASGNIKIDGTSHATKGYVLLNSTGGNVGIGTTTPLTALDVRGNIKSGTGVITAFDATNSAIVSSSAAGNSYVVSGQSGANNIQLKWNYNSTAASAYGSVETFAGNNPLIFQPVGGNVGIGTTAPGSALEVTGDVTLSTGADRFIKVGNSTGVAANALTVKAGTVFSGAFAGGTLTLAGGNAPSSGTPGHLVLNSGVTSGVSAKSGNITIQVPSVGGTTVGTLAVIGGDSGNGNGGAINLTAGGGAGSGGAINITGGAGSSSAGGNLYLNGGAGLTNGNVILANTAGNVGVGVTTPGSKLTVAGPMVSVPTTIASGVAVDLSTSNTFTLASVGGSAGSAVTVALTNPAHGGVYTLVMTDTVSHTYDFSGCTAKYWKPTSVVTTAGTRTIFTLTTINTSASNYDCYITWATGYQ